MDHGIADRAHRCHRGVVGEVGKSWDHSDAVQSRGHRIGPREDENVLRADVDHRLDLKSRGRHSDVADHEPVGITPPIGDDLDERAVGRARRHSRHELHPLGINALAEDARGARGRVDIEDELAPLIAGEKRDEWCAGVGHGDASKVGEGVVIPGHLLLRAVQPDEPQRDLGVGRARRRIAVLARGQLGLGGVGNPPVSDGGVVASLHEEAGAIREPPVAAHAIEFLCRDEVRQTPADVVGVGCAQQLRLAPVGTHDVEPAVADVGSALARGVHARIDDRAGRGQSSCRARRGDVHDVGRPRECEDSDASIVVERILRDARVDLAESLAACTLLVGEGLCVVKQIAGIDDARLGARRQVERPQACRGIGSATRAQEGDLSAIVCHRESAGCAEAESPGAGALAWIGLVTRRGGHGPIVPLAPGGGAARAHYACPP